MVVGGDEGDVDGEVAKKEVVRDFMELAAMPDKATSSVLNNGRSG